MHHESWYQEYGISGFSLLFTNWQQNYPRCASPWECQNIHSKPHPNLETTSTQNQTHPYKVKIFKFFHFNLEKHRKNYNALPMSVNNANAPYKISSITVTSFLPTHPTPSHPSIRRYPLGTNQKAATDRTKEVAQLNKKSKRKSFTDNKVCRAFRASSCISFTESRNMVIVVCISICVILADSLCFFS